MNVSFNKDKLKRVLSSFYNATGVCVQLMKTDFIPFIEIGIPRKAYCAAIQTTAIGNRKCNKSDIELLEKCRRTGATQVHICHAGLVDVGVPVMYDNKIIAYLILGQMKREKDFSKVYHFISELKLDEKAMKLKYNKLDYYDEERVDSIADIAGIVAKHLLVESMLRPNMSSSIERAIEYIRNNFDKKLNVQDISLSINVSPSVIYKNFHKYFDCTVSEYINRIRVDKSIHMLMMTDMTVEEIAEKVGFSSTSYYIRIFKKEMGLSPMRFKKGV